MAKRKLQGDWTDALFGAPRKKIKKKKPKAEGFVDHCPYCDDAMIAGGENTLKRPTKDHVMARSLGYTLEDNKIICCKECNGAKGSLTLVQWLVKLLKKVDRRAPRVRAIIERRNRAGRPIDTLPIDGSVKLSV